MSRHRRCLEIGDVTVHLLLGELADVHKQRPQLTARGPVLLLHGGGEEVIVWQEVVISFVDGVSTAPGHCRLHHVAVVALLRVGVELLRLPEVLLAPRAGKGDGAHTAVQVVTPHGRQLLEPGAAAARAADGVQEGVAENAIIENERALQAVRTCGRPPSGASSGAPAA